MRRAQMSSGGRRKGSTIAECLFTIILMATVMTTGTLLYSVASRQTLDSVSLLESGDSADRLAHELNFLISNAIDCEVVSVASRPVLKLTMPYEKGTRNANGFYDTYSGSFTHPRGGHVYMDGERIWIYCGVDNASITTAGTIPLLARRNDDATPGLADVDWLWTYRDGTGKQSRRSPGAFSFDFTENFTCVFWTIASRTSTGTSATAVDTTRESTFRDTQVDGATQIRRPVPQ